MMFKISARHEMEFIINNISAYIYVVYWYDIITKPITSGMLKVVLYHNGDYDN